MPRGKKSLKTYTIFTKFSWIMQFDQSICPTKMVNLDADSLYWWTAPGLWIFQILFIPYQTYDSACRKNSMRVFTVLHIHFITSGSPLDLLYSRLICRVTYDIHFVTSPLDLLHSRLICSYIWVRSGNCSCLVTWFCYQLIAKPGNKTATVSWPDPYDIHFVTISLELLYSRSVMQSNMISILLPVPRICCTVGQWCRVISILLSVLWICSIVGQ